LTSPPHDRYTAAMASPTKPGEKLFFEAAVAERLLFGACAAVVVGCLFYRLGQLPSGSFQDETSIGFNARALDRTLADQDGRTLPLFFRSFDDWKSPIPIYLVALSEPIFGVNPFAVRLPCALCALGMALALFFLLRELTRNDRLARWMALLSLLVPSIFFYARVLYSEVSCFPCFLAIAFVALLHFERHPSWRTGALAGAALGLCTYCYTTSRLLAPLAVAVAAASLYFAPTARRYLWAFVGAAAAMGAPMLAFVLAHPHTLDRRFQENAAWAGHPAVIEVVWRMARSYFQHLASVDFLFRTGQHVDWHNAGEGLLPVWLFLPLSLGLVSAWRRRQSAFVRFLLVFFFLSPIPVALTWQADFPHTSRSLHFVVVAVVLAAMAVQDWIELRPIPRWLPVVVLMAALFEGAQDLTLYFTDYAKTQERIWDGDCGAALKIAFAHRGPDEPLYLPVDFFWLDGTYVKFWGDLDPVRVRSVGLEGMGIHRAPRPALPHAGADAGGTGETSSLVVLEASEAAPASAELLGSTKADSKGPPRWSVYRLPGR
jgi:4-amino-4-deoxy-L-arabinose transferase-like glycosyltransferase